MSSTSKLIYVEPIVECHAFAFQMQVFPPNGYKVLIPPPRLHKKLWDVTTGSSFSRFLWRSADTFVPTTLVTAWLNQWFFPPPEAAATYSTDHLVFRREPWMLEVEFAALLVGGLAKHLKRFRRIVESALNSRHCRGIRCWSEAGRQSLLSDLNSSDFEHKVELIHYAVPPRRFRKEYQDSKVRLLFVGSGTAEGGFDYRGGREAVAVFAALRQRYTNLELVLRSDVPRDVRAQFGRVAGLRIIDRYISRGELDREFQSADILIIPSHNTSPMIVLDAMSYELPVVTIDSWANAEYVSNGETGLVAKRSRNLSYYYADTRQPGFASEGFLQAIRMPDPEVVADLSEKTRLLVENPDLRRRMGKAARREIEEGKFSLAIMNDRLRRLFECACEGN
jgi:glycosyltransferase involved in cell wall biosynthesis